MPESPTEPPLAPESVAPADSAQTRYALEQLRAQQNWLGGALAGSVAGAFGAAVWAGITVATGYQIGIVAIAIGFLVGFAVRTAGRGIDPIFGVTGGALALLACAAGNLLTICVLVAQQRGIGLMEILSRLDPALVRDLMVATFSPMDLVFYAIAVYEGYKLSFRTLTEDEVATLLPGS